MLVTFKKNLTFAKQGKNFRALLMYMIWFDPHQNPVCLIASLKQTMRLPCCCTCYSLCLKCPFPQGCWETLTDLLKPRSIMTSLGKGEVLVWLLLGTKAIISPKVLYTEGFLAITRWKCVCWYLSAFSMHPQCQNWFIIPISWQHSAWNMLKYNWIME